ncbi:MAG: circularly permuted type 2 ATP-grasp protein [Bacteroidota bacterium]|nr:circularly permuted type 2 ATP-grasp protein [Bacteroidota bacterium]
MPFRNHDTIQSGIYFPNPGTYDEVFAKDGAIKSFWLPILNSIDKTGPEQLTKEAHEIQHIMRENGVTYNVYNDPTGLNRTWQLDPIPFIFEQSDWAIIEKGIQQRARLFDYIFNDIYGENVLIKKGLLPTELIFDHPGYLFPCHGINKIHPQHLILYAADLARGPDGRMWVINDRLQAPSGLGYALENRSVMRRVVPDWFKNYNVSKLSYFFNIYRDALQSISPNQKPNPRIVVLTPGPHNETYFEHAYLSTLSGYTLVQGDDLIVKENHVWLKTIGGLEIVDVIIRRVDDSYCDPLELRPDSRLGVPGLLEVVRNGNVTIANPLGTGVLENPALMAFIPRISRFLFGEELIFPNVATWWCGQKLEMEYVLNNIQDLIIKCIYRDERYTSYIPSEMSPAEVSKLIIDIKEKPFYFVGQEKVSFSTAPSFFNQKLEPSNAVIRSFCVQSADKEYKVMHGGLTRSSASKRTFIVSNQSGGISKDTWVLEFENTNGSLPRTNTILNTKKVSNSLPSRTAENLYWVGRYSERSKITARLLRLIIKNIYQKSKNIPSSDKLIRQNLLSALTHLTMTYPGFVGDGSAALLRKPENELLSVVLDGNRQGSLSHSIHCFIRGTQSIRDRWAIDTWRVIDEIEHNWTIFQSTNNKNIQKYPHTLDNLISDLIAFMGFNSETMTREQGWLLLDAGRKLEASLSIISLMRSLLVCKYNDSVDFSMMESFLNVNENLNNYRYQYRSYLNVENILEMMLLDPINPGSLAFHISRLQKDINNLPQSAPDKLKEEQKYILDVFTRIRLSDLSHLCALEEGSFVRENLDDYLGEMASLLTDCSNALTKRYFSHTSYRSQMSVTN